MTISLDKTTLTTITRPNFTFSQETITASTDTSEEDEDFDEIPMEFDNLISFKPIAPEPPHSEEDHKEMETYNAKLQELMKRER